MASMEDSFGCLRLEKDVILLMVSQRVLAGWVLAGWVLVLRKLQVDLVHLGVNHPRAVRRHRHLGEQTDRQAGTTR